LAGLALWPCDTTTAMRLAMAKSGWDGVARRPKQRLIAWIASHFWAVAAIRSFGL
jgi:hypothetical protein